MIDSHISLNPIERSNMHHHQNQNEKPIRNEMYPDITNGGHPASDYQEKRKEFRKDVKLTGGYISSTSGERGLINLINVSRSGLRYRVNTKRDFYPSSKMQIKFTLDAFPHSVVSREAVIRNVQGPYVSAEFCSEEPHDGLSIYLEKKDE